MCVKMYYFNTKHVIKETTMFNQPISVIEIFSFQVNKIHVCI